MFGLTTQRRKNAAVMSTMSKALQIANSLHFMLSQPQFRVLQRLNDGETVELNAPRDSFPPAVGGRNFTTQELHQMGVAISVSLSGDIYPARVRIIQNDDGWLKAFVSVAR